MLGPGAMRAGTGGSAGPDPGTGGRRVPDPAGGTAAAVDALLAEYLHTRLGEARRVDAVFAEEVASRVATFVLRGGKRLRTAFVRCGWLAAGGSGDPGTPLRVGAALELLQACALVHDDVMDESPVRRGAPAVHAQFARLHREGRMYGSAAGYSGTAAVLAGDLALVWADDLLTETALGSPYGGQLHREWQAMRGEMVAGQYLDMRAQATGSSDETQARNIATLKSALYTVERPLALGASLAGADARGMDALRSAGRCAGLAFQLHDDLLGAFGDPAVTGKPADEDLRTRKLTGLLAAALRLADESGDTEALAVLGHHGPRAGAGTADRMRAALERTGARAAVEKEIACLTASSLRHFADTGADDRARGEFAALVARAAGTDTTLPDPGGEGA
ncbi:MULTISPECIES: polyprenyl synthetase family protein [Streptomyces]|uniref:Polyprenyl synthetase family protein n=1 Tax=Streptomyces glycanivorans TaxID=3033808 RepID=A0ABY9J5W3_9ACTN|nr:MULTISPECIES: polyprenyl synthetase family protein [unclassified Streptomyces]WSQ75896.1 polyprenyl synthetase family protein [Streptomyces sp. NBC_01213]WLQ62389.1 polyprenyl synthetase family protein [Streptomyces sp. Alt3]WSQ83143.1 polyprenyl synthetase family protein [Streptomyces sp. NBC_01212]WSR10827.1 polyprenyl synthetase family protein [Streptomyces sp. NBC_01208]WSR46477.1 polyprenyl synthetase family protein [Streptomyces sp. NBC_01201]